MLRRALGTWRGSGGGRCRLGRRLGSLRLRLGLSHVREFLRLHSVVWEGETQEEGDRREERREETSANTFTRTQNENAQRSAFMGPQRRPLLVAEQAHTHFPCPKQPPRLIK